MDHKELAFVADKATTPGIAEPPCRSSLDGMDVHYQTEEGEGSQHGNLVSAKPHYQIHGSSAWAQQHIGFSCSNFLQGEEVTAERRGTSLGADLERFEKDNDMQNAKILDEEILYQYADGRTDAIMDDVMPDNQQAEPNGGIEDKKSPLVDPYVGQQFIGHEDAYLFYNAYAIRTGFGTRKSSTNRSRDGTVVTRKYVCLKEGLKNLNDKREEGKEVARKRDTRTGCQAKMQIGLNKSGSWIVKVFDNNHNHPYFTPSKVKKIRSHNRFHTSSTCKSLIENLQGQGLRPCTMAKVINGLSGTQEESITTKQCVDRVKVQRRNNIGRESIAIIKHFQDMQDSDPTFYFSIELSEDQTLRSVFWADGRSIASYLQFGDVVCFDVTYKTNKFSLPFAPFTGVNHHRQSILFGCALLADESEETFVWLFDKWLKCMSDKPPVAIITDQDIAMRNAIKRVFPSTRHRFCSWHINIHAPEKTQDLQARHSDFWVDYKKWYKSSSKQKFEERWVVLKEKYQVDDKHWLSKMYDMRDNWIPAYLHDTFFAGMTTSQRSESINSFFDGFVHSNTPLYEFVQQYDNAIESRRDSENTEDYVTMNSIATLSTALELEKQAGERYTRKLFHIFQQQFKASFSCWHKKISKEGHTTTYFVGQSTEDQKKWKIVVYDISDGATATCQCAMFETEGILCMHILRIMTLKELSVLPERYILKRWTMSAKHHVNFVELGNINENKDPKDITPLMLWDLKLKNNKMLEEASKSIEVYEDFIAFLANGLAKVDLKNNEQQVGGGNDIASSALFSLQNPAANQIPEITIRDPTGSVKHKGRPRSATRYKFCVEATKTTKKQRTCGNCQGIGHYRTGCPDAKKSESLDQ